MASPSNWSLTTFNRAPGAADEAGILLPDGAIVQPESLARYRGLMEAMGDWDALSATLRDVAAETLPVIAGAIPAVPLRFPNKLLCAGANYHDHLAEMGAPDVPEGVEPFYFLLPPSTTLVPSGATVQIPADKEARIDWESELAVVIGKRATNISEADARDHVAGYACFNDITARGYHRRAASIAPPFMFDWTGCKGRDGFCPMGAITPAWMIDDPHDLRIRCSVDGVVKQDGNTSTMIFNIWKLVAYASSIWTLEPGDIIATGTPAGVGAASQTFLTGGEEVLVEIDGCAPLHSRIAVPAASAVAA